MKKNSSEILDGLEQHLLNLSIEAESPLKCYEESILYVYQILQDLKADFVSCESITEKEEIHFFKHVKPQFVSKLIYFNTLYQIESEKSLLFGKKLNKFYKRQLHLLHLFLEENKEFYNYINSGGTHLDVFYYCRNKFNIRLKLDASLIDSDPLFTTSHGFKKAQLKANEELKTHFKSQLIADNESDFIPLEMQGSTLLKWTATKAELIELIHALHATGVFNFGAATIKLIAKVFEELFGLSPGDVYGGLDGMKNRKGDPAFFLIKLKNGFLRKLGFNI